MDEVFIQMPRDCVSLLKGLERKSQEHFGVIGLSGSNKVIFKKTLFKGGFNKCVVDPKVIWFELIKKKAVGVIIYHNHPSGCTKPSEYDIELTKTLKEGCELLGYQLLDHVIIGKNDYFSFIENKLIFGGEGNDESKVAEK